MQVLVSLETGTSVISVFQFRGHAFNDSADASLKSFAGKFWKY